MIRVNLLPVRAEKRKENVRKHGILLICYVGFLLALVFAVYMSYQSMLKSRHEGIEKQKSDIIALDKTIKEVQNYKAKLADLTDKLNVVIGLEQRQRGPARSFGEISKAIPEKVWIEKMVDSNGNISIDGWAIDQQTIAEFMTRMEASKAFTRVTLKVAKRANKAGADLHQFSMVANLTAPTAKTALEKAKAEITSGRKPDKPAPAPAPAPDPAGTPQKAAAQAAPKEGGVAPTPAKPQPAPAKAPPPPKPSPTPAQKSGKGG